MAVAQGTYESLVIGIQSAKGTIATTGDLIPITAPNLSPNVNRYKSKAMTGIARARPVHDGKIGADGSFALECSRESLQLPLRAFFGPPVNSGTSAAYDHDFVMGVQEWITLEQRHTDLSPAVYLVYLDNKFTKWDASVDAEGLMESTFTPTGLSMATYSTEQFASTITDRTGSYPFNYVTATLSEGGSTLAYGQSVKWTIDRKLQRIGAIDGTNKGFDVVSTDIPEITVTLTAFFTDVTLLNKALNSTETSLEVFVPAVESGHGLYMLFPTGKYMPTGPASQGQGVITVDLRADFYARGTASNVGGSATSKYFTTVTVVGGTSDSLKVKVDGAGAQTFTLTAGARTPAQIVTDLAALTGATASVVGGRVRIKSSALTGSASSIQIDATGNAQTLLGFDTALHAGYSGIDVLARLTNADAT